VITEFQTGCAQAQEGHKLESEKPR
jgi:hypothetical protein